MTGSPQGLSETSPLYRQRNQGTERGSDLPYVPCGRIQTQAWCQNLPSLMDPAWPSPPRARPGTCAPCPSGPLSWDAPLPRSWHLQTSWQSHRPTQRRPREPTGARASVWRPWAPAPVTGLCWENAGSRRSAHRAGPKEPRPGQWGSARDEDSALGLRRHSLHSHGVDLKGPGADTRADGLGPS